MTGALHNRILHYTIRKLKRDRYRISTILCDGEFQKTGLEWIKPQHGSNKVTPASSYRRIPIEWWMKLVNHFNAPTKKLLMNSGLKICVSLLHYVDQLGMYCLRPLFRHFLGFSWRNSPLFPELHFLILRNSARHN